WLKECMDGHSRCKYEVTSLPTRVIDVGSEEIEPRLYVTNGEKEKYVTMSHCWGGKCPVMTTTETIEDHKQGLPMNLLPKTFREAIIVTRSLGIRYLWIDSLCIIQNSKEDWEAEALRMSDVYANCYLMIAADASSNCEGGCFPDEGGSRNPGEPKTLSLPCPNQDEVCHHLYEPLFEHRRSPLNKRGWTLQERILAPRALHCGKYEIAWECADRIACECQMVETAVDKEFRFKERFLNPMKDAGQPSPASIAGNTWLWVNIVEEFTRRSLTRYTDTLPALSGLAQRMCPSPANQYVCGIWRNHFVKYLNWEANYDRIPDVTQMPASLPRRNEGFDIPTWSWASIVGPIRFP
ncbi:HET-domain-containing protein, partial [Sporormia fimetaria CBS 119925]